MGRPGINEEFWWGNLVRNIHLENRKRDLNNVKKEFRDTGR
jgi:hypothetical protein